MPMDRRMVFQELKDDCSNHAIWIYDRAFNNEKSVDIVFLGSSHFINGINDQFIEESLKEHNHNVVNLGYCRLGRNFSYVLFKEILESKKPKHLILEVRGDEDRYSHPIFPYIGHSSDVLLANPLFNRDIFSDIWTHISYKIAVTQDVIYGTKAVEISDQSFGFASSADTASLIYMDEVKEKRANKRAELSKIERNFHMFFARTYLDKINLLCVENNVKLWFLYIPEYGRYTDHPKEYNTYIKYGQVLIPPLTIFDNQENWGDENHLNQTGAIKLSKWVSSEIEAKFDLK